jgi:hypothetical protein
MNMTAGTGSKTYNILMVKFYFHSHCTPPQQPAQHFQLDYFPIFAQTSS